jgi:GntR family transcriptional regulator, transcriptional repressor for pyruvate dehydrogenase complex
VSTSPSNVSFTAVRRTRVYEGVVRQLQNLIAEGALKPGDMLPPERELAERFGVSRSSLRDAIRSLELAGLVIPKHGEGTVVADLSVDALVAPLASVLVRKRELISELLDVRKMLEPALAARAALNATDEDVEEMEDILRRQREKAVKGETWTDEDSEFHDAVARAAHNTVVLKVLDVLMDLLRETRARALQVEGRAQRSLAGHRRVLDAIRRRDPEAAERAVKQHIQEIEKVVLKRL